MNRRLAAIMFTDLVGSTAAAQRDEKAALHRQEEQERILRPIFHRHGGREVKSTGDGFLVEFESALRALECAVEAQRSLQERNSGGPQEALLVRIGIHLGDVEQRGQDIFGDAVNLAARVEPFAEPGGICLSEPVYVQVRNKVPYTLGKIGTKSLKGVHDAMTIYKVVLPWAAETAPPGARLPRIAVLPLSNISPDPDNAYFADGLTEELITVLSQIKGLRVISRTSVVQYKGTTKPVAEIGAELGADSILEGSVRKAGDQLRITVQLIDTRSDEHRWAQTYDRKLENVFAIQADVAERAAGALKVELLGPERKSLQERPTISLEAYEAYLRGIQVSEQDRSEADVAVDLQATSFFEEAIRKDPRFSAAYARLASHLIMVMGEVRPTAEVVPRIRALVAKALELSPDSSDSYTARGALEMQVDRDWARAEADVQKAIALNPSNSVARQHYALLLVVLQRFDEARKQAERGLEQDPLSYVLHSRMTLNVLLQGDLGSGVAAAERLQERYPEYPSARSLLASVYATAGRREDALRTVEPFAGQTDDFSREEHAFVLALLGRGDEAREFLADWEAGRLSMHFPMRYAASLCAVLGESERALALLERDAREGDNALWHNYQFPVFDGIRKDPRFIALLRAQNLPTTLARPMLFHPPVPPV